MDHFDFFHEDEHLKKGKTKIFSLNGCIEDVCQSIRIQDSFISNNSLFNGWINLIFNKKGKHPRIKKTKTSVQIDVKRYYRQPIKLQDSLISNASRING